MKAGLALAALVLFGAGAARADDEICARIEAFHAAPFVGEGDASKVRWVEMRWDGAFLSEEGWGMTCVYNDEVSAEVCDYLVDNTSFEFRANLPKRVLECFGYAFPRPWGEWREWRSDIDLSKDSRRLLLEIDLTEQQQVPVVRLSSFAQGQSAATTAMPPLGRADYASD